MHAFRAGSACLLLLTLVSLSACDGVSIGPTSDGSQTETDPPADVVDETVTAGANQNDRSAARDGEDLRTGAMVVSPSGRFVVMQRNTVTLVYEVATTRYRELPDVLLRVAFGKRSDTVYAARADGMLAAIDLASATTLWTTPGDGACALLRIDDADDTLLASGATALRVLDARTGAVRSTTRTPAPVAYAAFVPGAPRVLAVGRTVWRDGGPHTPVLDVDLTGKPAAPAIDVPNCAAPIVVVPDGSRAFLSPTYCSPGAEAVPGEVWTNPDPVSVIDLDAGGARFRLNLPGFGPVALAPDGTRLVAYLDVARMDEAMFQDRRQVPWKDGPRYHLMTIDPRTLAFQLAPIGNAIPRFAMTRDGRSLVVDASAKRSSRVVVAARAEVTLGPDGLSTQLETNLDVFGSSSAFGRFDLETQSYAAFDGPAAPLDRFVQLADGRRILTLARRADGLGGVPYMIDLAARRTWQLEGSFGSGVRDVGLAEGGASAILRLRLPANVHDGGFYSREGLCLTADGTCGLTLTATFEASIPFALVPPPTVTRTELPRDEVCPESHDCF